MKPDAHWNLPTRHVGRRVLVYDRLDSTNRLAASLAGDEGNDGLAVLAREQTAGRGQHGRTWLCPRDAGVLLSVLLFPPAALKRPAVLTAWAAVSVCETIRQVTGQQARIKWPNDIYLHGKKVCGILIEQARATVVGIGLNVNVPPEAFAAAGLSEAASLSQFSPSPLICTDLARQLLGELDAEYGRLGDGDLNTLEACWKWRVGLLGRPVRAECGDAVRRGRLLDLTFDGLALQEADGELALLVPELVKHLGEDDAADGA